MTKLDTLYQEIAARNQQIVCRGGTADDFLLHPEQDTRMGVTLLFRVSPQLGSCIRQQLDTLQIYAPELYYYPPEDFHVTVMDLQRAMPGFQYDPQLVQAYSMAIREAVQDIGPFQVHFRGMIASDAAVLVKGYYGAGLEQLRQNLRRILREKALPLAERYETFSCHMSVVRFPCKIAEPHPFYAEIVRRSDLEFGTCKVSSVELVYHNWYDSRKELLDEIILEGDGIGNQTDL